MPTYLGHCYGMICESMSMMIAYLMAWKGLLTPLNSCHTPCSGGVNGGNCTLLPMLQPATCTSPAVDAVWGQHVATCIHGCMPRFMLCSRYGLTTEVPTLR